MNQARWEQVQNLFHHASTLSEPDRSAFLEIACGEDQELLRGVRAMLAADADTPSILDRGIDEVVAHILEAPADSITEQQFGPYRLVRILGEGGMGVVWLAERTDAGNLVAIKFLPHAGLSPSRRERFAREIRTLAKLKHPYIARLYDAGTLEDGTPWFVMEYVEGARFADYCREPGRPIQKRLLMFRRVCEAVQYAHSQEIIHRDLKPSNILVAKDGTPRLLDFGIAREMQQLEDAGELTRSGLRFFSADYSAPEWAREGVVGFSIDVYSLGVIFYEILTGQLPSAVSKVSIEPAALAAGDHPVEKPSLVAKRLPLAGPGSLDRLSTAAWSELDVLCLKAMHPDARERYQSVEALIRDIDHYLKHEPLEARPDSLVYRANRFFRRNRPAVLATCAALFLIAATIVFFTVRLARARNAALAEAARERRIQQFMQELFDGGDPDAGPANDIHVAQLLDRGALEAQNLSQEPEVQADLNQTLGTMYEKLGRLDRADTLLQLSLQERRALSTPDPAAVADNLISVGLLRSDQGRWQEAERIVRQAMTMIEEYEPRNRQHWAKAEFALGKVTAEGGHPENSVPILHTAIAIQSAPGGSEVDLARSVNALADAAMYMQNFTEADSQYRRALQLDTKLYGTSHPLVAENLSDLGQIQEEWGHYADAEKLERQSVAIAEAWYGPDHPDTARKMTALASTLEFENHVADAKTLLQQALGIVEKVYGPMSVHVAFVLNRLAAVATDEGDFKTAETDYNRCVDIYSSAFGRDDYRVAVAEGNLGSVYFKEKKDQEAELLFRKVIQSEEKSLGPDNISTAVNEIRLGRLLRFHQRYEESVHYSLSGLNVLLKQTDPSTSWVRGARADLVLDYQGLHKPEEAAKYQDGAAKAH